MEDGSGNTLVREGTAWGCEAKDVKTAAWMQLAALVDHQLMMGLAGNLQGSLVACSHVPLAVPSTSAQTWGDVTGIHVIMAFQLANS